MTHAYVLLLVLGIGIIAGLRSLTAPAVVAWAGFLNWIDLGDKWSGWMAHPVAVAVLSVLAVGEMVVDKLSRTPSRKASPPFIGRLITGGFAGAVLGSAWHYTWSSLGAGIVGAVLGTLAGYEFRSRVVAATGGRDLPVAVAEDVLAVGVGFLFVYLASFL